MKKEYVILIVCFLLIVIPALLFGEVQNAEQVLKHAKGDGAIEDWFMEAFVNIDKDVAELSLSARRLGQAIGGIGALLTLGYMGWQMQVGDREWEIMPMFRPFFIGLILLNWTSFYSLIQTPFQKLAEPNMAIFKKIEKEANDLRVIRFKKQLALTDYLIDKKTENDIKEAQTGFSKYIPGSETFASLGGIVEKWGRKMEFSMQKWTSEGIETVALFILRFGTYIVFFIQKIWSYILIVVGPIAIGLTLFPGFESSLTSWIAKFININLFGFIAFSIMNLGQAMIMGAYKMEIHRLSVFVDDAYKITEAGEALLPTYLESYGLMNSVIFTAVAYVISGIGVMMTPTIADSVVSAGGAAIMSKMKGNSMKTAAAGMAGYAMGKAKINNALNSNKGASERVQDAMKAGKR